MAPLPRRNARHPIFEPFQLPFVQRALFEVLLLSIGAGLVGTWIVLRGLAFYSHAVGAAAFPGLVLADGLGFAPWLGALGAAILFAASIDALARTRRAGGQDSITALALTGALALGVVLASDVFHSGSNVETLLFGSILVLGTRDLVLAGAATVVVAGATVFVGRAWLATGFDPDSARASGIRPAVPEALLLLLVALVVIASLSALGALLASALIVVPAATVRLWTQRMLVWQAGTVALTAAEGVLGIWLSVKLNAPAGAALAVLSGAVFALAALSRELVARSGRGALLAGAGALLILGLGACGSGSQASSGGKLRVLATTTQIADWTRAVGGGAIDVHQILQPNTDPHEYELRPADVQAAAGAKVAFTSGDNLDSWAGKLVSEAGGSPAVIDLGAVVPTRLAGESSGPERSRYDPHWWHDPLNAAAAVKRIGAALAQAYPGRANRFERAARAYAARITALDRGIRSCFDKIPRTERKLVTDHDAFGYFARRYDIEVVGAVINSQTTEAGPSAGDVTRLAALIKREHVRAIFPESSLSPKLARAIASQTGASSSYTLYGDTLGPRGSKGDTYLKMEAANADAMASGFSGGRMRCTLQT